MLGQWRLRVKKHNWTTNADYNEGSSMLKRIFCNLTHSLSSEFMKCLMFWRPEPCFFHFWAPAWIRWIEGSPMTFHISAMNFKTRKGTNGGIPVVDSLSLSLYPSPSAGPAVVLWHLLVFADLTRQAFASFNMRWCSKDPYRVPSCGREMF